MSAALLAAPVDDRRAFNALHVAVAGYLSAYIGDHYPDRHEVWIEKATRYAWHVKGWRTAEAVEWDQIGGAIDGYVHEAGLPPVWSDEYDPDDDTYEER